MIIDRIEQLKEWLTNSLSPICEADPGALAKYVVALVKKDKPLSELKDSCVDQLDVFLQSKTKPFVETLFQVLDDKSYIVKDEPDPVEDVKTEVSDIPAKLTDSVPDIASSTSDQQLVTSTSKIDIKKEPEIKQEIVPPELPRRKSPSPRYRGRDDDRRRRFEDRRPFDRGFPRRRSVSPRYRGRRSRSPYRRRSPFRPLQRSRSPPRFRVRERGRSRSKSWSRSRSWSRSPKRSFSRSPRKSRTRSRSRDRLRSPGGRIIRSSKSRSPRRLVRPRSGGRSPIRRSLSPRYRSRSPRKRSLGRSKSPPPKSKSGSPGRSKSRSRSGSLARKVKRQDSDSRGPTPTLENGLADSTNVTPSESTISVVSTGVGRFDENAGRVRCRDFDEKGFCVRGEHCPYDHGADPVIVENVPSYPPGHPLSGQPPHLGPPPPGMGPGGPFNMSVPPPGFFTPMGIRPPPRDISQEPYNPEAPALSRPGAPPYWPGGPPPPHFMNRPPPPHPPNHIPVKSRLGNRDLVNLIIKPDIKDDEEDDDKVPTSSSRTVIAPKDDLIPISQPPPPGVSIPDNSPQHRPPVGPTKVGFTHPRFHPYKHDHGPRKFDYNRIGGYRKPDQSNCTLEVRKVPLELNNIAKINEHFGKFGQLTNIQVKFEGDPEAALVTFSTNQEAYSCYKSSEPVFNNRFVKLFWHQKDKKDAAGNQEQAPTSTTSQASQGPQVDSSHSLQSRLGPIPPFSKMSLNNLKKPPASVAAASSQSALSDELMAVTSPSDRHNVVYTTSMGNINKTVYNPAALKPKPATSMISPTAVKAADFVSRMEKVKQHEQVKQEMAQKKLEIQKQKQQLLIKQIEQQKKLIDSLEKGKDTMKEETKKSLMEALKTLSLSIDKLKTELGSRNVVLKQPDNVTSSIKSPEQAKKEILDVELELMTKDPSGEETAMLKKKLADLTSIANSMGLLNSGGRGRGRGVARGRGSLTWTAAGIAPLPPPVVGRGRGRGMSKQQVMATRTLDRRPKIVEVSGFDAEEKEDVLTHLKALHDVEKVDVQETGNLSAIVEFKTRKSAEQGILYGAKFKGKVLKMLWHIPKPDFSRSSSTTSVDTDDHEEIDEEALLAGVEDEEEEGDEDNRAWRR